MKRLLDALVYVCPEGKTKQNWDIGPAVNDEKSSVIQGYAENREEA